MKSKIKWINKIFEIGVMKTGTTSLGSAFDILGFKRCGWSPKIAKLFKESQNDYEILFNEINKYDAFEDGPWHDCDFRILDKKYPNSKFILLERDDTSWIRSLEHHTNRMYERANRIYDKNDIQKSATDFWNKGWEDPDKFKQIMINFKNQKYKKIKNYFSERPNDLLSMKISEGWSPLCNFLNKPIPNREFPKDNITKL